MRFKRRLAWILAALLLLSGLHALAEEENAVIADQPEVNFSIDVDIINQIVTVYPVNMPQTEANIVRQMICSTGYGNATPRGSFEMCPIKYDVERQEWYYFTEYEVWAKYASRIQGNYLFHSILYANRNSGPTWASSHALGSKASHGCIRLRVEDAKWIAENCPPGTMVYIHEDNQRTPEFEDLRAILLNASFSAEEGSYAEFRKGYIPLSKGSRYSKVVDLQEKLNALGYDCGKADGIFGSATEKAVKAWQTAEGHDPDGIVRPDQLQAILTAEIPAINEEPEEEAVEEAAEEPAADEAINAEPAEEPAEEASDAETARVQVESGSHLLMRTRPDVQAQVIASLPDGAELTLLDQSGEWRYVRSAEGCGWVNSAYLQMNSAQPAPIKKPVSYAEIMQNLMLEDLPE